MSVDVFTVDSEQIAVTTDALANLGVMTVDGETTVVAVGSGSTDVQVIESGPPGAAGPTGATGSAGPTGATGSAGPAGSPGALWYSATGGPPASGTGIVGDYGLVTSGTGLGDIYKKTGTTTWTLQGNIRGATGATGAAGTNGTNGAAGSVWFNGTVDPTSGTPSAAIVGDYYLNTTSGDVFKKTGSTTWTLQGNIKGPTGAAGSGGGGAGTTVLASNLIGYVEATASATYATTSTADVDVDAANLAVTFTAPASGKIYVEVSVTGENSASSFEFTLREGTSVVKTVTMGQQPTYGHYRPRFVISGLTPGSVHTYKLGFHRFGTTGTVTLYTGGAGGVGNNATMSVFDATPMSASSQQVLTAGVGGDAAWITPTLNSGWASNSGQTVQYRKDSTGKVRLQGSATGGTGTLFTLPVGYRPSQQMVFATSANGAFASVVVNTDGTVAIGAGSATGLYLATVEFYDVNATTGPTANVMLLGKNEQTAVLTSDWSSSGTVFTDILTTTFTPATTSVMFEALCRISDNTSGAYVVFQVAVTPSGGSTTTIPLTQGSALSANVQQSLSGKRGMTGLTPGVPLTVKLQGKAFQGTAICRASSFPSDEGISLTMTDAGAAGGLLGDPAWIAPTAMQNGWVDAALAGYPPLGYRKDALGFVHLRGYVKNGTSFQAAFTLPSGYRPAYKTPGSGSEIGPTGTVTILSTSQTDLGSTVPFLAEA